MRNRFDSLTLRADDDLAMSIRGFGLTPETLDENARTVEAILATERQTTVFDMKSGQKVDEVLRMDGLVHAEQAVLVDSHPQQRNKTGITTEDIRGSARNLQIDGEVLRGRLHFADDAASQSAFGKVKGGHVRELSIGASPIERTIIPPGRTQTVRGKQYTAGDRPLFITTKWTLGEVSLVARGADPNAKIRSAVTSDSLVKDADMTLRQYLESIGLAANATATQEFEFLGTLTGEQLDRANTLRGHVHTPAPVTQPAAAPAAVVAPAATVQAPDTETIRSQAAAAERQRISRLTELAGSDVPAETLRTAIENGWDENRASREFLGEIRGRRTPAVGNNGPAIHSHSHEGDCTLRALSAGLGHLMGRQIVNPNASETLRHQQEQDAEMGYRFRNMALVDYCREAVRLDGGRPSYDREETIRAATSGASLVNLFTTNVNARVIEAYNEIQDSTQGWVRELDVADFKTNDRIFLGKTADLKRLPRGKKAPHATISDNIESYKIARYANQFVIDEQDIIDNNIGGLQEIPVEMGHAAGRLRPSLVYAIILNNAALGQDSIALFHTSHSNIATGGTSPLSTSSLEAAIVAIGKQTQDGVTLNLMPRFLIVPQDLRFTAQKLLVAAELRDTTASTKYPTYNALKDLAIEIRVDNRMGVAGVTDPTSGTAVAGTATNWLLTTAGREGKTIEVGYLQGSGRAPQVRSFQLEQGQWGMGWDIKMDIGAKALDYRSMYFSAGA